MEKYLKSFFKEMNYNYRNRELSKDVLGYDVLDKYDITKYNKNKDYDFSMVNQAFKNVGKSLNKAMEELEKSEEYIRKKAEKEAKS